MQRQDNQATTITRNIATLVACLFVIAMAAGCASTKVSDRQVLVTDPLPRPGFIWIYDFAATPAEVPADSTLAHEFTVETTPQTAEDVAAGQALGQSIAAQVVDEIRGLGLPVGRADAISKPGINDIVIRGYLVSIDEGNAAKRVAIGFGSGKSELRSVVEGYQVTAQGMRKLGSGAVDSGGSKGPGAAVGMATFIATANPAGLIISSGMKVYGEASGNSKIEGRAKATAKEISKVLKQRFKDQGWID